MWWSWKKKEKCGVCSGELDKNYAEIIYAYMKEADDEQPTFDKMKVCSKCTENLEKARTYNEAMGLPELDQPE